MQTIKDAAAAFLANERIAVTGVSRRPREHGANTVFTHLRDRGYVIDGGCPLMFDRPDLGHRIMRVVLASHVPRTV